MYESTTTVPAVAAGVSAFDATDSQLNDGTNADETVVYAEDVVLERLSARLASARFKDAVLDTAGVGRRVVCEMFIALYLTWIAYAIACFTHACIDITYTRILCATSLANARA